MNLVVNAENGGGSYMLQNIKLNIIVNAERGQDSSKFQEIKISMVVNAGNGGGSNMLLTPRSDIEAHKYTDCGKLGFKEKNKGSFAVLGEK